MARVLCVGIATLDYVYAVPELPSRGEKYRATDLSVGGGGCAGNAAAAIARLGGEVSIACRLGDDLTADRILSDLAAEGVAVELSRRFPGIRSPVSSIVVDRNGERMVISFSDPVVPDDPGWLPQALPRETGAVLTDTRWGAGALAALSLAGSAGVPGVLDGDRKPADPRMVETASHVAFSAQGLAELTGEAEPELGLAALQNQLGGGVWLAVTLGPRGVLVACPDGPFLVPAFPIEAVDTLGAGDVWHGAFALALAEGRPEIEAVRFASASAAIKCTRFGGRSGAPNRAEVEALLATR